MTDSDLSNCSSTKSNGQTNQAANRKVFWCILGIYSLSFCWAVYLSFRQLQVYVANEEYPANFSEIISSERYAMARTNGMRIICVSLVKLFVIQIAVLVALFNLSRLWDYVGRSQFQCVRQSRYGKTIHSVVFVMDFIYFKLLIEFIFNLIAEGELWVSCKLAIELIMLILYTFVILNNAKYGPVKFVLRTWITLSAILIAIAFFIPFFNLSSASFPDGNLKQKADALAIRVGFPPERIFFDNTANLTSRTAYLSGFGPSKTIVIQDAYLVELNMLKEGGNETEILANNTTTEDEILAVLGHELGHWKNSHMLSKLAFYEAFLALYLLLFGILYRRKPIYRAFGFLTAEPVAIGIVIVPLILAPYDSFGTIAQHFISQRHELEADDFSASLDLAKPLASYLITLFKGRLIFPFEDYLFSLEQHTHPPLLQRIERLMKIASKLE